MFVAISATAPGLLRRTSEELRAWSMPKAAFLDIGQITAA
jgi:hypothetical protein